MTLARRIIPCLDVDAGRVVKGIEFEGLRDMGDPAELAARYNREGADELVVLDISASHQGRATFLDTIRRVAEQLNIPLTAGGGIRKMEDGRAVAARRRGQSHGQHRGGPAPGIDFGAVAAIRRAGGRALARRETQRRFVGGLYARRPRRDRARRRRVGRRSRRRAEPAKFCSPRSTATARAAASIAN